MKVGGLQINKYQMHRFIPREHQKNEFKTMKFENFMNQMEIKKESISIKDMIEGINEIREILENDLTLKNLQDYKKAVSQFLNHFVRHELSKDQMEIYDRRAHYRQVEVVSQTRTKLGQLAETLLETNKGHLETLKIIGEIQGMIVDLYA